MLNFKNTIAVFFLLFCIINLLQFVVCISIWYYLLLFVITLAIVVWGSSSVSSGFHFKVICSAVDYKKQVSITFDDGPSPGITPMVLDILRENNIKAAFFCIGRNVEKYPEITSRIVQEGHMVGNHSWSHSFWFDLWTGKKMASDMSKAEKAIFRITGKKVKTFRPPYGVTNPMLKRALKIMGYLAIGWSIRSMDTGKDKSTEEIYNRVVKRLKPGDVILFHDTMPRTVQVLKDVIHFGIENEYTFVRLDDLINVNPYHENNAP
jgi:peptidoglycan-N-acetylglucosamine deacetylase